MGLSKSLSCRVATLNLDPNWDYGTFYSRKILTESPSPPPTLQVGSLGLCQDCWVWGGGFRDLGVKVLGLGFCGLRVT